MSMQLRRPDLLAIVMEQTHDGQPVSVRELAEAAGVSHQTIHKLRRGKQKTIRTDAAELIAHRIGCGVAVLFSPGGWDDTSVPDVGAVSA